MTPVAIHHHVRAVSNDSPCVVLKKYRSSKSPGVGRVLTANTMTKAASRTTGRPASRRSPDHVTLSTIRRPPQGRLCLRSEPAYALGQTEGRRTPAVHDHRMTT